MKGLRDSSFFMMMTGSVKSAWAIDMFCFVWRLIFFLFGQNEQLLKN